MAELKDVRGVGPKSLSLLNKININTIEDLIIVALNEGYKKVDAIVASNKLYQGPMG